jgi:hypothetical protein
VSSGNLKGFLSRKLQHPQEMMAHILYFGDVRYGEIKFVQLDKRPSIENQEARKMELDQGDHHLKIGRIYR